MATRGGRPPARRRCSSLGRRARAGRAFAAWTPGGARRRGVLALARGDCRPDEPARRLYPQRAVVQLNLGIALFWAGLGGAEDAWRAAAGSEPDSPYAVAAGNLLHPEYARGLPIFVTTAPLPARSRRAPRRRQLDLLRRGASRAPDGSCSTASRCSGSGCRAPPSGSSPRGAPGARERRGAGRRRGRPSTSRAPPTRSRGSGRLPGRFPASASVRFHLGLLLLWAGEVREARTQLTRATRVEPGSPPAEQARATSTSSTRQASCNPGAVFAGRPRRGYRVGARNGRGGPERASATSAGSEHGPGGRPPVGGRPGPSRGRSRAGKPERGRVALALDELDLDATQLDAFYDALDEEQIEVVVPAEEAERRSAERRGRPPSPRSRRTPCSSS